MGKKIAIITGATGYIGSNLVRVLLSSQWRVICIKRPDSSTRTLDWVNQVEWITYDGDFASLIKYPVDNLSEAVVIHLAAVAVYDCPAARVHNLINANVTFGAHLLEAMLLWGARRFIFAGTYWQYGIDGDYRPVCLYAATKAAFEKIVEYYAQTAALQCVNLVLFDVYGPFDPRNKILRLLDECAFTGKELLLSPGLQNLDMVFISDVVRAFMVAAESLLVNTDVPLACCRKGVSSGRRLTLKELVAIYECVMGIKLNVSWHGSVYRERTIFEPWIPSMNERLDGWAPVYDFTNGLREILKIGKNAP